MAPRQGRQPRHQPGSAVPRPSTTKQSKPSKSKSAKSKPTTSSAPLDVYSYSTNVKRARGDVDPEARASFKGGKGKARQDSEDEDLSEDDLVVGADGIVEFTGVKPKGLKMGMSDDEEGGVGGFGTDDEEIDSDEAEEDEDHLPVKQNKVSHCFQPRADYLVVRQQSRARLFAREAAERVASCEGGPRETRTRS